MYLVALLLSIRITKTHNKHIFEMPFEVFAHTDINDKAKLFTFCFTFMLNKYEHYWTNERKLA